MTSVAIRLGFILAHVALAPRLRSLAQLLLPGAEGILDGFLRSLRAILLSSTALSALCSAQALCESALSALCSAAAGGSPQGDGFVLLQILKEAVSSVEGDPCVAGRFGAHTPRIEPTFFHSHCSFEVADYNSHL